MNDWFIYWLIDWLIDWLTELENVAIANALQIEASRATPALSGLNYDAIQNLKSLNLSIAFSCWYYFTPWPWPLTFDLEHLQRIACDVMKLSTIFECNRAIRGGVIAISVFDLMTLNIALRVALGSGIIFTKFDLRQVIGAWIIAFFLCWYVMTRRDLDLWPLELELL